MTNVFEDIDSDSSIEGYKRPKKQNKFKSFITKQYDKAKTGAKNKFEAYKAEQSEFKAVEKKAFSKDRLRQAKLRGRSKARAKYSLGTDPRNRVTESAGSLGFGGSALRSEMLGENKKKKPERFGGFL